MKKIILIAAMIVLYAQVGMTTNPSMLEVTAASGLKMRVMPNLESEVLAIIPYSAKVQVVKNELSIEKSMVIDYVSGKWVEVEYDGMQGYVFDGFLSHLPMPEMEWEKTQFDLDLIHPLETWVDYHGLGYEATDTIASSSMTKIKYSYGNNSIMERMNTPQYYKTRVYVEGARIMDVYHLLNNMLKDKNERKAFSDNTLFIEGKDGQLSRIKVELENPVLIKKSEEGVWVEIKSYSQGCTLDF